MEFTGENWCLLVNSGEMAGILRGQHDVKVGEFFRISFPKEFRELLGEDVIATYGFENSLIALSESNWEGFIEEIKGKSFLLSETRELRRIFIGGARKIEFRNQGRFVLPEYLRKYMNMGKVVTFVGQETYVEIWNKDDWEKQQVSSLKNMRSIGNELYKARQGNE